MTRGIVLVAALVSTCAGAAPLSHAEVTRLCGGAEGLAHCGRLVETEQLKRLPALARRDGATLRVALYPEGSVAFTDLDTLSGGTSYALWDDISEINAAVLFVTKDDDASFLLLQRATGRQTALPAEPVLAPHRQRLATADFCAARCENRIAVWRVARDGVTREIEWSPAEAWSDVTVRWKDADTLIVEYTAPGAAESKTVERRLADPGWIRR